MNSQQNQNWQPPNHHYDPSQPQQYQHMPPGMMMMWGRGRGRGQSVNSYPHGHQYRGNNMQGNQPYPSSNQVNEHAWNQMGPPPNSSGHGQQCRGNNMQGSQTLPSQNQVNEHNLSQIGSPPNSSGQGLRVTVSQKSDNGHQSRFVEEKRNRSKSREDKSRDYREHQTEHQGRSEGHQGERKRSRSRGKKSRWDNPEQNAYNNNGNRGGRQRDNRGRGKQDQWRNQGQHQGNPYSDEWGGYYRQGSRSNDDDMLLSRTLSSILRHNAKNFGLELDKGGFLYVEDILYNVKKLHGFTLSDVQRVVDNNDKKRFSMEKDGEGYWKIRANQGHTIEVEELALTPITSADNYPYVIHGTYYESWEIIKETGLKRMNRNHIHFAADMPGSSGVISGMRKSCEVVIYIDLEKALKAGIQFFVSANNVILSPGNEDGTIYPCFFRGALDRRHNFRLEFDSTKDGSKMAKEKPDAKNKRKKNKGKGKQHDFEEDTTEDRTQQQGNKKPKNSKDPGEQNIPDNKDSVTRKKSVDEGQKRPSQSVPEEPAASQSKGGLESGTKDHDTTDVSAGDSAFENSMDEPDSPHDKMSDCFALPENDDSLLAQAPVNPKDEGSVQDAWDDDDADPDEEPAKIPEWNDQTVIDHPEESISMVDNLLNSEVIAVCCAGEKLGTVDSKIRLIVVLGKPHIGVYKLDGDGSRLMKEGNLHQLLVDTKVPKVFHTIQETAFSLIQEHDILLDGVPIWDVKMMYEKVGDNSAVNEQLHGLKAWDKIQKWSSEDKISDIDSAVANMVTRGKFMLHLYGLLHELIEKDSKTMREFKSEIYSIAVPKGTSLDEKVAQLKLEKKGKKQAKEPKPQPQQQQNQSKKQKKKKKK